MTSQDKVFEINTIIFLLSYQKFCWQSFIKIKWLSQELLMSEFEYQNSTKWWRRRLKPRFIKFGSRNQMLFMFKFQYKNGKKRKRGKIFWVTKQGNKEIANRGRFEKLQIRGQ